VTCHRQLKPASEGGSMNRHHYWLLAVFNAQQQGEQASTASASRGHLPKFFDVGPGDKSAAGTDHYCRS